MEIVNRDQAIELGLKRYYTGLPCKNGHFSERLTANKTCIECERIRKNTSSYADYKRQYDRLNHQTLSNKQRERRAKNHDAIIERERAYRQKNNASVKEKNRLWNASNSGYHSEWRRRNDGYHLAWSKQNPDKIRSNEAKVRAKRNRAFPLWFSEFDQLVIEEAFQLCKLREFLTGIVWHVDHIIPLLAKEACGLHTWSNVQVIPAKINIRKRNRMILINHGEWIGSL